jgi:hypothetical protein
MKYDSPQKAADACVQLVREELAQTSAFGELEVMKAFVGAFSPEVDGWDMRIQELEDAIDGEE